jgi:hypothetical protein
MRPYDGTFELIDPKVIVLDHKYQRPEKWDLISKVSTAPEWVAFVVVLCSKRIAGSGEPLYYCLDGQQRLQGVLSSINPPDLVPVVWFPVANVKEEARLFAIVNTQRKAVNAMEKYRAQLTAEDPRYVQISAAVGRAGFTIGSGAERRTIGAIEGLQTIYNAAGEDGVELILTAIAAAWPEDKGSTSTWMLRALADVLDNANSNGRISQSKLVSGLKKSTPGRILRRAEEMRFDVGGSKRVNVRRALKELTYL